MTWHKMGTRYNPDKLVHPSDAESWTHFQEDGLDGTFQIDLTEAMRMEQNNERIDNDDAGDEVHNVKDLELLERLRLDNDNDDDSVPPMEIDGDYIDTRDSDDET